VALIPYGAVRLRITPFPVLGANRPPGKKWRRVTTNLMADVISDYQKWKQQGENLRVQAKQAMETRFREVLTEAVSIAEEYRSDFGATLKPPPAITAFRFKTSVKGKAKKSVKPPAAKGPTTKAPEAKPDPKVAGLQKQLAAAKKKLEDAKAANAPTRKLEDRVYEIEDDLRLAGQTV
jgi:hypothetical protein